MEPITVTVSPGAFAAPAGSAGLPRPLDAEVPRPALVRRLEQRWERPVTLVVAGPGFGKTTVLAQAVRAHLLAPRGIDVWVSCEAAHEDAAHFARALIHAVSAGHETGGRTVPGARDVIDAVIRRAPLEVCLLLDDVHEIPVGSPGAALLREVAVALPATAHLVLCGRQAPELPLARREAAGEVIRIGGEDLVFTDVSAGARLNPAHALCFLPLPWSVELAARLAAAGHPHGLELGRWLADTVGPPTAR